MHTYDVMSVFQDNSNQTVLYLVKLPFSYQIDMLEIEGVKLNLINVNQGFKRDLIHKLKISLIHVYLFMSVLKLTSHNVR